METRPIEDESFTRDDWYAEEWSGRCYQRCTFSDVDLTEAVTRGVVFNECSFANVRFNASRNVDTAFTTCTFTRCNFFDAEFEGCKLVGSEFNESELRPLRALDPYHAELPGAMIDPEQAGHRAGHVAGSAHRLSALSRESADTCTRKEGTFAGKCPLGGKVTTRSCDCQAGL